MSTSNQLTQFWIEFIELYKSLPQLWKVNHEGYCHKYARTSAYKMMLAKYREFDEGANMDHVKKKIANMRTSFRRESKKVDEDNTYEPTLWYYPHMEFIRDQDDENDNDGFDENETYSKCKKIKREEIELNHLSIPKKRKLNNASPNASKRQSMTPSVNTIKSEKHRISHIDLTPVTTTTTSPPSTPPPPPSNNRYHYKNDEARTLSATWEVLFRKLDSQQKLFANRIITEVLYLGALKKLKSNSHKLFENLSGQSSSRRPQENPINISYDNGRSQGRISNIHDALRKLKQLENFAIKENHEALDLIMQLEDSLKNSGEDHNNEEGDEDIKDYDDQIEDVDDYDF